MCWTPKQGSELPVRFGRENLSHLRCLVILVCVHTPTGRARLRCACDGGVKASATTARLAGLKPGTYISEKNKGPKGERSEEKKVKRKGRTQEALTWPPRQASFIVPLTTKTRNKNVQGRHESASTSSQTKKLVSEGFAARGLKDRPGGGVCWIQLRGRGCWWPGDRNGRMVRGETRRGGKPGGVG